MKKLWVWAILLSVSFICTEFFPRNAEAIPAFARKYKTACITCHATFPRLTPLGEAFRLNGYKMPEGDELYIKDEPVNMGAEGYKKVFPESVWPSDIPGLPPIAIRIVSKINIDTGGTAASRSEFVLPDEIAFLAAGSMGTDMSFFTELAFPADEPTETVAWLMWEDLFSGFLGNNHLNIKAGSVGRHEIALPNTRSENRITNNKYLYSSELDLDTAPGVELNGFDKRWRYSVGAVKGDETHSAKDYFCNLSFKLGGLGYDGSGGTTEEGGLNTTPSGYWRDDALFFGVFAYRSYIGIDKDNFDRLGADLRWNYKDLSLVGGYIQGNNDATKEDKHISFAELEYFVYPWLQPYVRYEHMLVSGAASSGDDDLSRIVAGAVLLARANVKLNVEGMFYTKNDPAKAAGGEKNDEDGVFLRLDYAF